MSILERDKFNEIINNEVLPLSEKGKNMEALKKLDAYIKEYPSSGDLYALKVIILNMMKDESAIIQTATQALDLGIKYAEGFEANMYFCRGNAYTFFGKYQDAMSDLSKGISLNPNNTIGYLYRGDTYRIMEPPHPILALQDYEESIRLDAKNTDAYMGRASTWIMLDNHANAAADFRKAESLGYKLPS